MSIMSISENPECAVMGLMTAYRHQSSQVPSIYVQYIRTSIITSSQPIQPMLQEIFIYF